MKIKNSQNSIKFSLIEKLFFVLTAVSVVLRTVQRIAFIDFETGFYKSFSAINTFYSVFLLACCVLFVALSYLSGDTKGLTTQYVNSKPLYGLSLVLAVCFLFDGFGALGTYFSPSSNFEQASGGILTAASSGVIELARAFFAVLSTVYFVCFSLKMKNETKSSSKMALLPLSPVLWSALKLFTLFKNEISYLRVSDLFMEILMMAFLVMYFFALAQSMSGVGCKASAWKLSGYGLSASFICASVSIPRLISTVISKEKYINSAYPFSLLTLILFVFTFVLAFVVIKSERLSITSKENENNGEE